MRNINDCKMQLSIPVVVLALALQWSDLDSKLTDKYFRIETNFTGTLLKLTVARSTTDCLSSCSNEECEALRFLEKNGTCTLYTKVHNSTQLSVQPDAYTDGKAYMVC